jgi:Cof subfamily protein (haloacid dehalogenase superfamily)
VAPPHPIRLVAVDIDGTLLRSDRAVSPRTRAALAALRPSGVRLVLVTGRRYPSARRVAEDLGGDPPLVLHNGALVIEGGTVLRYRPLPRTAAEAAIRLGREAGAEPVLHCGARGEGRLLVAGSARPGGLVRYYLERSERDVVVVEDLALSLAHEEAVQVMFGGTPAQMFALLPLLEVGLSGRARVERTVYPADGLALLDVLDLSVGKADALAFLQARWGITPEETLAIGDNWNDREMLARAGRGFVMGNAPPELRGLGLPVLPTNDEDGVAVAIEAHVLAPGNPEP